MRCRRPPRVRRQTRGVQEKRATVGPWPAFMIWLRGPAIGCIGPCVGRRRERETLSFDGGVPCSTTLVGGMIPAVATTRDLSRGSRGGSDPRERERVDPRDVFMEGVNLPRSKPSSSTACSSRGSRSCTNRSPLIHFPTPIHLTVTCLVAEPPRLLLTVMVFGLDGHVNWPLYLPPPLLASVPMSWPVAVT